MAIVLSPAVKSALGLIKLFVPESARLVDDFEGAVADGSISIQEGGVLAGDVLAIASAHVGGDGARYVKLISRLVPMAQEVEAAIAEFKAGAPAAAPAPKP